MSHCCTRSPFIFWQREVRIRSLSRTAWFGLLYYERCGQEAARADGYAIQIRGAKFGIELSLAPGSRGERISDAGHTYDARRRCDRGEECQCRGSVSLSASMSITMK